MVQVLCARGWDLQIERGPDWLFVRPHRPSGNSFVAPVPETSDLAEQVWAVLEQNFTHRLVLELDDIGHLNSHLIGQLVWLYKRIHTHDGTLRICGLSSRNEEVLRVSRLDGRFPLFETREDAVMGFARPAQPR